MKYLKTIGSIGILSPLIVLIIFIVLFTSSLNINQSQSEMFRTSFIFGLSLYFSGIFVFCFFVVGTILHGIVAYKKRQKCTWAWWVILITCIFGAFFVHIQIVIIMSILIMISLFKLTAFQIMKGRTTA